MLRPFSLLLGLVCCLTPTLRAQSPSRGAAQPVGDRVQDVRSVTGTVYGASRLPIARAIVYVVGSELQITADDQGRFSIPVPARQSRLRVQAMGYHEKFLSVLDTPLDVTLDAAWPEAYLAGTSDQQWDPDFPVAPGEATWAAGEGPTVHVDEGHHNFHTASGRYRTFAHVLEQDGIHVARFRAGFTAESLREVEILVVATPINALADPDHPSGSPFLPREAAALRAWVENGGSLLLISDHLPIPAAFAPILTAFDIHGVDSYVFAYDEDRILAEAMIFRAEEGLGDHPITRGRTPDERVDSVATFTGFAFRAPRSFRPLLTLQDDAWSMDPGGWFTQDRNGPRFPVAGWLQGAAAELGRGRIVVMGEAAMFTAQVRGPDRRPNGLSSPEAQQNAQFLLNVMHWLGRVLD